MAISTPGLHKNLSDTSDSVFEMAKIGVAGGESVQYFGKRLNKPMWKRGDLNDLERFKHFAKGVLGRVGGPPIDFPHNYWSKATSVVREDFEQKRYNSEIEGEATIAMVQVFPLVFLNTLDSQ